MFSVIFRPNTNSFRSKFGHNSQIGNLGMQRKYKIQLNAEKSDTSVGKVRLCTLKNSLGCQIVGWSWDTTPYIVAISTRFRGKSWLITTPPVDIRSWKCHTQRITRDFHRRLFQWLLYWAAWIIRCIINCSEAIQTVANALKHPSAAGQYRTSWSTLSQMVHQTRWMNVVLLNTDPTNLPYAVFSLVAVFSNIVWSCAPNAVFGFQRKSSRWLSPWEITFSKVISQISPCKVIYRGITFLEGDLQGDIDYVWFPQNLLRLR